MSNRKQKFWPMTPQQSFIAAAIFLSALVAVLLFPVIGKKLLSWISVNAGLAAWLQAIGALAIVFATYELHNLTRNELRNEGNERRRIDNIKTKFFINQNSETFKYIHIFLAGIEYTKILKDAPYVKYHSVEYFRIVNRHMHELTRSNSELANLFLTNSIPDSCLGYLYEINIYIGQLESIFSSMTSHSDIANTLKMIGAIDEINKDPLENANAEFLNNHLKHSIVFFDERCELIRNQLEAMMNDVFDTNE